MQVTYLLQDDKTINREFGNLLEIKDNYPKYLLTLDEVFSEANYDGILKRNVLEWLLTKKMV